MAKDNSKNKSDATTKDVASMAAASKKMSATESAAALEKQIKEEQKKRANDAREFGELSARRSKLIAGRQLKKLASKFPAVRDLIARVGGGAAPAPGANEIEKAPAFVEALAEIKRLNGELVKLGAGPDVLTPVYVVETAGKLAVEAEKSSETESLNLGA